MKRKQRKSLLWRRFGYVILIIIKFDEILLWISPRIINALRSYIKHSKERFIRYQNTSLLVKKNSGCASFFNLLLNVWTSDEILFLVFDILLQRKLQTGPLRLFSVLSFLHNSKKAYCTCLKSLSRCHYCDFDYQYYYSTPFQSFNPLSRTKHPLTQTPGLH